jgi:monoamine oxidase
MPPHLLARIPNDFSTEAQSALAMTQADAAGKIGLQFRRRFWEEDDGIYGGRSLSNEAISQIYYPCEGYAQPGPAALIGYYHFSDVAAAFSGPHAERERLALEQGSRIHPQYREEFENSFSVEWDRVRYSEMAWALWGSEENFKRGTSRLREGDGPFFFAGDWLSNLNGWQAGAFVTAHVAAEKIHARALQ